MNKKSENIYRVLWAVLFLVNLGASIALNYFPAGHVLIALPQAHQSPQFHGAEKLYVLALGLGVSIVLGYLWIRWDRATRPDEFFP